MPRISPLLLAVLVGVSVWTFPPSSPGAENGPAPEKAARQPKYQKDYETRTFKGSGEAALTYGWLAPSKANPGEKYPLVICLHGSGGGTQASGVLARPAMREQFAAFVMVPQAEPPFTWAKTDVIRRPGAPTELPEKMPVLLEAIRSLLKTEAIDPARIYITGQSLGGVGSWGAIARAPELFAAAAPVCGAWRVEDAPKMVPVPIWAFHGEKDPTVPAHFSQELTAAVTKAGGTAKYTEYPGVGHDSWMKAYEEKELWTWMFAQRKPVAK